MANTYSKLYIHLVFSTKERAYLIKPEYEERLSSYIRGIAKQHNSRVLAVGGTQNHLHLLLVIPPSLSISKITQYIKGGSSRWLNEQFFDEVKFRWQRGYGVFSINESLVPKTIQYIRNQKEHHASQSYREEFKVILQKHNISDSN